jgi:hypothetical protein
MKDDHIKIAKFKGGLYLAKKSIEHSPVASEQCNVLLIEPVGTMNTGDAESDLKTSDIALLPA